MSPTEMRRKERKNWGKMAVVEGREKEESVMVLQSCV
jgi:hypothetical protein